MNRTARGIVLVSGISLSLGLAAAAPAPFTVTSSSLKDGDVIQKKYAADDPVRPCTPNSPNICPCPGQNISPALSWSNAPAATKSFAILIFDADGLSGLGVSHWVAYGIPANVTSFAEGETSKDSKKFVGGTGTRGGHLYVGPCPPPGDTPHHYLFTVIALDLAPNALKPGLTREDFLAAAKTHALTAASIGGKFGR